MSQKKSVTTITPKITNIDETDDILKFTLQNVDVSIANAIRRTLLSDIPCVVFKTIPYNDSRVKIDINTTNFNNEYLKQRLSCIPIHIDDADFPIDDYRLEIDVENTGEEVKYITTEDFRIKNTKMNNYLNQETVRKIFPAHSITHDFIDFVRLQPRISATIPGGHLKLDCALAIGTAGEEAMFNVVATAAYKFTQDPGLVALEWDRIQETLRETKTREELEFYKRDWLNLDAKRLYVKDSFDFIVETIGIYTNMRLIDLACNIIIKKLITIGQKFKNDESLINDAMNTMENCYDITLQNEDYTIGKILEHMLFRKYYGAGDQILSFCGFIKEHPHNSDALIRVAFKNIIETTEIVSILSESITELLEIFKIIQDNFTSA